MPAATSENALITKSDAEALLGLQLAQGDAKLLNALMDQDARVDVVIPDSIQPDDLWRSMELCCNVLIRMKDATKKLKPMVGRMLLVLQRYPEIYKSRGYKRFDDFMTDGMDKLMGISRAEAYHCMRIAKNLPSLTPSDWDKIGIAKLELLARDDVAQYAPKILEQAKDKRVTVGALKQIIYDQKFAEPGRLDYTTIVLNVPKTCKELWTEFWQHPAIREWAGSNSEGMIFERLLQESMGECISEGQFLMDKKGEAA